MQISNNNTSPQFGAFLQSASRTNKRILSETLNLCDSKIMKRAFNQFKKEQSKVKHYDTIFNPGSKSVYVIDEKKGLVIKEFPYTEGKTGLDISGTENFPVKKLLTKLFNPKKFLPENFYLAGEKAKSLEREFLEREEILIRRERLNKDIII